MLIVLIMAVLASGTALATTGKRWQHGWQCFLVPAPAAVSFLLVTFAAMPEVIRQGSIAYTAKWIPQLDVELALRLNGLGLLLLILVTGIGALILLYAVGYMKGHPQATRLFLLLYLFMFSMAGLAIADHMLLFFIFWELTSISSYFLIGFQHKEQSARQNALQALIVTGLGGMALMAGFILIAQVTGTWNLSELPALSGQIQTDALYVPILILVLLGAFTKSAQFPFHFWLPNAMSAPTPVSAYLHSATMVKAGIFLLFLMLPVLGGTGLWTWLLTIAGAITLLTGGAFGLVQHDLKKILAGTTVAVLGLLTLLLGIGTERDVLAALVFLFGHALYKATLFMVAGSVDHETGTRDTRILGGLYRGMPWTAVAATLAAFSKMGLPPFFGFLGKEYTYKASLESEYQWLLTTILIVGNAIILALAFKAAILPFWRKAIHPLPEKLHDVPWSMRLGPILMAGLGIAIGTFPFLIDPLISSAKSAAMGYSVQTEIKLWHGLNLPLILSALTLSAGLCIIVSREWVENMLRNVTIPGPAKVYDILMDGMVRFAIWQTRLLQSGQLRNYLLIIVGVTTALISFKLWRFGGISDLSLRGINSPELVVITVLMAIATLLAVTTQSRLTALIALGLVGFGVAWIFAYFSAPDLAITQILVETLTVVLFAWVVYKLPQLRTLSSRRTIITDAVVSGAAGILITILVLKSQTLQLGSSISKTLSEWSLPEAYGANVVNVILVDFRAIDTWGEVCVVTIAAIGVWALASGNGNSKDRKSK
ncbi:MAG: hydrogen gas-evolving membrane-bound hydrogenase subunit E [Puniceicoccaceae bacterium]